MGTKSRSPSAYSSSRYSRSTASVIRRVSPAKRAMPWSMCTTESPGCSVVRMFGVMPRRGRWGRLVRRSPNTSSSLMSANVSPSRKPPLAVAGTIAMPPASGTSVSERVNCGVSPSSSIRSARRSACCEASTTARPSSAHASACRTTSRMRPPKAGAAANGNRTAPSASAPKRPNSTRVSCAFSNRSTPPGSSPRSGSPAGISPRRSSAARASSWWRTCCASASAPSSRSSTTTRLAGAR